MRVGRFRVKSLGLGAMEGGCGIVSVLLVWVSLLDWGLPAPGAFPVPPWGLGLDFRV